VVAVVAVLAVMVV
jgi:hypothetical protein